MPLNPTNAGQHSEGEDLHSENGRSFSFTLNEEQWREKLTGEEYAILREAATEAPGSGEYVRSPGDGTYLCRGCANPLFSTEAQFDSGCGWPAFFAPRHQESVTCRADASHGMERTEVLCARCGSHLGHVFSGEGYPTPTDLRFCINSGSLQHQTSESRQE